MLTWKPKCGKNHGSPQTAENHYERNTTMGKHRGNDLLHPFFATRRLQWRQRPLSLSLSVTIHSYTHTIQLIMFNNINCFCPKSYLYTYDFRAIYTYGPKGLTRTHSRMCPFQPVEGGYHRAFSHPVLLTSHPEGPVSQHLRLACRWRPDSFLVQVRAGLCVG